MDAIEVYYNGQQIIPAPTVSYQTQILYNNDLVIGYQYDISLNGYAIPSSAGGGGIADSVDKALNIKNIFNSNGGALKVAISGGAPLLYAVDNKIISINWDQSNNNWSQYIPYTIELQSNHLYVGTGLSEISEEIEQGDDNDSLNSNLHSPSIVDIEKSKIKTFSENLSFNIDDNNFNHMDIYDEIDYYDEMPFASLGSPATVLSSNYFTITYTLNATGKHDIANVGGEKTTLPAWENAKRFVHNRLLGQLSKLNTSINTIMRHGSATTLSNLHNNSGSNGVIDVNNTTGYSIFNETIDFDVSESDGTFSITYNALAKERCSTIETSVGCSNSALHTVTKKMSRTYNANAPIAQYNHDITISIDGEITGLVPGVGPNSSAAFIISNNNTGTGSFLTLNQGNVSDKSDSASTLFNAIFDYSTYDLKPAFKSALGITSNALAINPNTIIKPSRISLTRNLIQGTINYSAEYNNKYNCPTNHYSVDISVDEPIPVIAEFVIPNNTLGEGANIVASGFSVIQKLGTSTAKKINITINGNDQADDILRCCLGTDGGWNLLNYGYFSLGEFTIPSGINIPAINPSYVLTSKQKRTTYPRGEFNITLSYTCADVCDIDWS